MTDARVAVLEQIARDTKEALMRIEARFDRIDGRFERLDAKIDTGLKEVRDRQEHDFRLIFGVMITTLAGVAAWLLTSAANLIGHKLGLI